MCTSWLIVGIAEKLLKLELNANQSINQYLKPQVMVGFLATFSFEIGINV
jgi:hypothetical protein